MLFLKSIRRKTGNAKLVRYAQQNPCNAPNDLPEYQAGA